MSLGDRVKDLLKEYDWSHGKLAEKAGIPRPTVTAIANNKYKKVNLDHLFKIAQALAIPPGELLSAAGYRVHESRASYDSMETPEQLLASIKLLLLRLEHVLDEQKGEEEERK